jgi:beta-xylosidase
VIGKSPRYCNPLPLEASSRDGSPRGVSLGGVTVVREGDAYYMFNTGGAAWVSTDLVHWEYRPVTGARVPVAPHVVKFNGMFYMSGNGAPLYRAPGILGPHELVGPWLGEKGEAWRGVSNGRAWTGAFDVFIWVDDDNAPYLYCPGRSTDGIFVVPLDPDSLNRFAARPTHLFAFDPSHQWERWGEANEYSDVAWIEGPWVIKREGTYYLQYSASGTQWTSYATGYYTGKSPLGPFTYAPDRTTLDGRPQPIYRFA